jgi:serine/threonine protein phosphatase PrpC
MTTARTFKSLLLAAALFAAGANAAGNTITVAAQDGKTVAQFTLGDSSCVLKDDQIQCTPTAK